MQKIGTISRFYLSGEFKASLITIGVILALHLGLAGLVNLVSNSVFSGIVDLVAPAAMFSLGITMFVPSFRYLMSQSFSRKTFFVATVAGLAIVASIYSLLITIYFAIIIQFGNNTITFAGMYDSQSIPGLFLWEFAYLFMLITLGWCIRTIGYVAGRMVNISIFIGLLVLLSLVIYFNVITGGAVFDAFFEFLGRILGVHGAVPNPYIATGSFMVISLLLSGITFVFIRRAQVRD